MGDRVDRAQQVVADGRRRVDQDHAVFGGQEHDRVVGVGHPVQVILDLADEVAVGAQRGPERALGHRRVVGQRAARFRRAGCPGERTTEQGGDSGHARGRPVAGQEGAAARR